MNNLSVKYLGLTLKSPIVVASSGLTTQMDKIAAYVKAGAGAIVVKSLFEEQISNQALMLDNQIHTEGADYLHFYTRQNALGKYLDLIKEIKTAVDVPVIASINCFSKGEWVEFASKIEGAGADALELNIFSLPLNINGDSKSIEQEYLDIVRAVSQAVKMPVAVKIGEGYTNIPSFANSLKGYGAKGVVMFNRFYQPDIDLKSIKIVPSDAFSHPEEHLKSLRWVAIVSSLVNGLDISASTGVHNGTTVIKQILAGASTVQMCSALYKQGAEVISDALADINLFMDKNGFRSLDDFRGKLNYSSIDNPERFERVQFMKTFGSK